MPKFVNVTGHDLHAGARPGHPKALYVKAGQLIDVPGEAVDVGDAWQVKDRLYPKATWELVQPKKETSGKPQGEPDKVKE